MRVRIKRGYGRTDGWRTDGWMSDGRMDGFQKTFYKGISICIKNINYCPRT
jgi:hypothetical protein